ncbi:hypothetical protein ABLB69_18975 [Xenorhabdus khoisanae]|uniref:hypothetical protein n=1 Tax=Xenorhabdus khoisanae TaxID=880157 RepID=UPI0032B76281
MKKYILLGLVTFITTLAPMQTYAAICSNKEGIEWQYCMAWCIAEGFGHPNDYLTCVSL